MLRISKISFPGLGIGEFSVDSVAFTIFGKEIAWYGIVITLGIVFCFWYITMRGKRLGLVFDDIVDIGLPTVLIGILGARAYQDMGRRTGYLRWFDCRCNYCICYVQSKES